MSVSKIISDDSICAPATAHGSGAIGVIRVSGNKCFEQAAKIIHKSRKPIDIQNIESHRAYLCNIIDEGSILDEALVTFFKSPHSYTGENSLEISCHGSQYIEKRILELLIRNGIRMAKPGEFTMRAFVNGKMDLSQAEAVADLIASKNKATHTMAISQLRGHFSSELSALRDKLLKLTSLLELELDFSDEDVEFADRTELISVAKLIDNHITTLAQSFEKGIALKQGVPIAIIGKTNVGKSTLLNTLLKDDRAIVSDTHGTTRDTIEETIDINRITFRFIDTAGLRHTDDKVEQIGIERTYKAIEKSDIIIWVVDEPPTNDEAENLTSHLKGKKLILAYNKTDIPAVKDKLNTLEQTNLEYQHTRIEISAKKNINIDMLESAIVEAADIPEITENDVIVTNARHYEAITRAHDNITNVINGLLSDTPSDIVAEDLRFAINNLAEITGGQITTEETLSNIFTNFCIGK